MVYTSLSLRCKRHSIFFARSFFGEDIRFFFFGFSTLPDFSASHHYTSLVCFQSKGGGKKTLFLGFRGLPKGKVMSLVIANRRPRNLFHHQSMQLWALLVLFFLVHADVASAAECSKDDDCKPSGCCHSALCVAATSAPSCAATQCSAECQPFTLDCGGKCFCSETGRCSTVLSNMGSPVSYSGGGFAGGTSSDKKKKYSYGYQRVKRG
jgi:hypothetical protein